jgi:hypothetical protein
MSREAFEKWAEDGYMLGHANGRYSSRFTQCAWEAWQAALQSGEPVAWMSPNKQSLEFSRPDTVYGSHTIPLYASPQPVVDVNQQLVDALRVCEECLMFIHGGEPLRTDVPLKLAREALLVAGKGAS